MESPVFGSGPRPGEEAAPGAGPVAVPQPRSGWAVGQARAPREVRAESPVFGSSHPPRAGAAFAWGAPPPAIGAAPTAGVTPLERPPGSPPAVGARGLREAPAPASKRARAESPIFGARPAAREARGGDSGAPPRPGHETGAPGGRGGVRSGRPKAGRPSPKRRVPGPATVGVGVPGLARGHRPHQYQGGAPHSPEAVDRAAGPVGGLSPLARHLEADSSAQALRPADPSLFRSLGDAVGEALVQSVPKLTAKKDRTGWAYWEEFTTMWGTPALRTETRDHRERETFLAAAFVVWLSGVVPARGGRGLPKPKSLLAHLHAVGRVHRLHGLVFDHGQLASTVVKTLNTRYCEVYGTLTPGRKEPLTRRMLRTMLEPRHQGLSLGGGRVLDWGSWFGTNLAAAMAVSSSGGFRKGELALAAGAAHSRLRMSRASLFWIIGGELLRCPSPLQLAGLQAGDKAGLLAGPCKNDPWGVHFGAHPLYFAFVPGDPDNTAARLRTLVLECPVEPQHLQATPLFSAGPDFAPMRHHHLDAALRALLRQSFGEERAQRYSWHSFRIGLACSLLAAGASEATIMALCRWRSPEALRSYARLSFEEYVEWLRRAEVAEPHSIQGPNVPAVGVPQLPRPELRTPGALRAEAYDLHARALEAGEVLSEEDLAALVRRLPETDADAFVEEFAALQVTGAAHGGGGGDGSNSEGHD